MAGLRALTLRGGFYTAGRQLVGMALSFAGLAALVRFTGPGAYGVYVSAFAFYTYAVMLLGLGLDVFLVRQSEEPTSADLDHAFTLALVSGGLGLLLALPGAAAAEAWTGAPGLESAMVGLFACLPLQIAGLVPSAVLQRRMDYRRLAGAELAGLLALYAVALPLAAQGAGAWAAVAGYWGQQVVIAGLFFWRAGYRPRLRWEGWRMRAMLAYGLPLSGAIWTWHARFLATPLIVTRLLGPEAAAAVAVTLRIAESLSFMRTVAWRVAIPAMGRIQGEPERLAAAIAEGLRLQLLVTGPAMLAFSLLAPWLVPLALGRDWLPMVGLFPFIALAYLANSVFSLHFSALHVIGRNGAVALSHLLHVALLFAAAQLLLPHTGLAGYGYAELAATASYALAHALVLRRIGPVPVGLGLAWAAGFGLPLFAGLAGPWVWMGPVLVLALPATRRALAEHWLQLRGLAISVRSPP